MTLIRRTLCIAIALLATAGVRAQSNGSNSSYSRFGLGTLNEQSQGFNRGMGGVAQGFQDKEIVNMQNPASYSLIDSLTFIFDVGMGLQSGRLSGGGQSINAFNATLEYINAGLRLRKGLGLSFGFAPFSTIGYSFSQSGRVGSSYTSSQAITTETNYYGNGGLHEIYVGLGWNPVADLSIGVNAGYLWGDYNHSLTQTFYEGGNASSAYNVQNELWTSDLNTYRLDIGLQYPIQINAQNRLTLGATAGLGHTINSKVRQYRYTSQGDTIANSATKAFSLPYSISAGATWKHKENLTVGADYSLQRWSGCKIPMSQTSATANTIRVATDQYSNRHHLAVGAEYIRNPSGRRYGHRINYRLGASYTTPYVKVNGRQGPREYSVTAGLALPLTTRSRSLINVSAEWLRRSPSTSGQIKENYLMLHLGVTFNESWFMKWRFQ